MVFGNGREDEDGLKRGGARGCVGSCHFAFQHHGNVVRAVDSNKRAASIVAGNRTVTLKHGGEFVFIWAANFSVEGTGIVSLGDLSFGELIPFFSHGLTIMVYPDEGSKGCAGSMEESKT